MQMLPKRVAEQVVFASMVPPGMHKVNAEAAKTKAPTNAV